MEARGGGNLGFRPFGEETAATADSSSFFTAGEVEGGGASTLIVAGGGGGGGEARAEEGSEFAASLSALRRSAREREGSPGAEEDLVGLGEGTSRREEEEGGGKGEGGSGPPVRVCIRS